MDSQENGTSIYVNQPSMIPLFPWIPVKREDFRFDAWHLQGRFRKRFLGWLVSSAMSSLWTKTSEEILGSTCQHPRQKHHGAAERNKGLIALIIRPAIFGGGCMLGGWFLMVVVSSCYPFVAIFFSCQSELQRFYGPGFFSQRVYPWTFGPGPKRKGDRLPSIIFKGRTVDFRGSRNQS